MKERVCARKGKNQRKKRKRKSDRKEEVGVSALLKRRLKQMTIEKVPNLFNRKSFEKYRSHLRILPPLIVNPILHRALLVFLVRVLRIKHFGFI